MSLGPGARLGPYEILATLGAGGMGTVYRARDPRLGRDVAVKVLPEALAGHADRLRRFEQEARAAGALNHPGVLAVFDVGTHEGVPYLVSEVLEGKTLRECILSGPLTVRKAIEYGVQIAHALAAAHDHAIAHRDLKPENLFLTEDGRVKILDFGLAKLVQPEHESLFKSATPTRSELTAPGRILGTVGYMSPEQVRGTSGDHRSDIFSLGNVLYELLGGRRAFAKGTAAETLAAILNEEPPELPRLRPDVPPALDRIVRRCLEKRPEDRFQSARDLGFALEALSGATAPDASSGIATPGAARRRRRRIVAAAGLLIVGALGTFLAGRAAERRSHPSFEQLTFRRGALNSARFTPDGRTIVYSAAWEGGPPQVYTARAGDPVSTALDLPPANLLDVSSSDELALLLTRNPRHPSMSRTPGTLARASLSGGTPREVATDVRDASFMPDGRLAVARVMGDRLQIEMPLGRVVHHASLAAYSLRASPKGDRLAFVDGSWPVSLQVVDSAGKMTRLAEHTNIWGIAWSPRGDEVWFTGGRTPSERLLYAVDLSGRERLVHSMPGSPALLDVGADGRALLQLGLKRFGVAALAPGAARERELSVFDRSIGFALSEDGRTLLIQEQGAPGGVYLRGTDGSPPTRLGDGHACDLSRDRKWVLVWKSQPPGLFAVPTGIGEARQVSLGHIEPVVSLTRWLPDGERVIVVERAAARTRLFLCDLAGGQPRGVAPGLGAPFAVSTDGAQLAGINDLGRIAIAPLAGGSASEIPGLPVGWQPVRWSADSRALYVTPPEQVPGRVFRVDPRSGRKQLTLELMPDDPAGVTFVAPIVLTADARSYAYTYYRNLTDLYVATGLR